MGRGTDAAARSHNGGADSTDGPGATHVPARQLWSANVQKRFARNMDTVTGGIAPT